MPEFPLGQYLATKEYANKQQEEQRGQESDAWKQFFNNVINPYVQKKSQEAIFEQKKKEYQMKQDIEDTSAILKEKQKSYVELMKPRFDKSSEIMTTDASGKSVPASIGQYSELANRVAQGYTGSNNSFSNYIVQPKDTQKKVKVQITPENYEMFGGLVTKDKIGQEIELPTSSVNAAFNMYARRILASVTAGDKTVEQILGLYKNLDTNITNAIGDTETIGQLNATKELIKPAFEQAIANANKKLGVKSDKKKLSPTNNIDNSNIGNQTIRVKVRATGQTGTIPANEFNTKIYERITQ